MDVARLLVQVEANTAQAEAGLAALHKNVALAAIGFGVIVVAAAAVGVAAVKMAGDFQMGLTTLVTGAGESATSVAAGMDQKRRSGRSAQPRAVPPAGERAQGVRGERSAGRRAGGGGRDRWPLALALPA